MADQLPIVKLLDEDLEKYVPFEFASGGLRILLPFGKAKVAAKVLACVPGRAKVSDEQKAKGTTIGNAKLHFEFELLDEDVKGAELPFDQAVEGTRDFDGKKNALGLVDGLQSLGLDQAAALALVKEGHSLPEFAGLFLAPGQVVYLDIDENIYSPTTGKNAGKTYISSKVKGWTSKTDHEAAVSAKQHRKPLSAGALAHYLTTVGAIPEAFKYLYPNVPTTSAPAPTQQAPTNGQSANTVAPTPPSTPPTPPPPSSNALAGALGALLGKK